MRTRHNGEVDGTVRWWRAAMTVAAVVLAACSNAAPAGDGSQPGGPPVDGPSERETAVAASPSAPPPSTSRPDDDPTTPSSGPAGRAAQRRGGVEPTVDAAAGPVDSAEEARLARPSLVGLEEGDSGPAVEALQARLTALGFDAGPADGRAGRLTTAAVSAFQVHAGVEATGVVDAATAAALTDDDLKVAALDTEDVDEIRALQKALAEGPFDPGPADGVPGDMTVEAAYALQKLAGLEVDGVIDGVDRFALDRLLAGDPLPGAAARAAHDRRWVEVDLSRQLMAVYDPGSPDIPVLAAHVSSGNGERWCNASGVCGVAATPTGSFTITRRISGWRQSSLDIGALYNPLYFRGGIALHGARSVPLYPASHGCVRVPMHIAEYLPAMLPDGTPVEVYW